MDEADGCRRQPPVRERPAYSDDDGDQEFHLLAVGMPGDTGVSYRNSEIACRGALEDDACIDDRAVALHSLEGVAERLGRGCDIEEQSGLPEIEVAGRLEAEKRLPQRRRRKLQKCDLARNADAGVRRVDLEL